MIFFFQILDYKFNGLQLTKTTKSIQRIYVSIVVTNFLKTRNYICMSPRNKTLSMLRIAGKKVYLMKLTSTHLQLHVACPCIDSRSPL